MFHAGRDIVYHWRPRTWELDASLAHRRPLTDEGWVRDCPQGSFPGSFPHEEASLTGDLEGQVLSLGAVFIPQSSWEEQSENHSVLWIGTSKSIQRSWHLGAGPLSLVGWENIEHWAGRAPRLQAVHPGEEAWVILCVALQTEGQRRAHCPGEWVQRPWPQVTGVLCPENSRRVFCESYLPLGRGLKDSGWLSLNPVLTFVWKESSLSGPHLPRGFPDASADSPVPTAGPPSDPGGE